MQEFSSEAALKRHYAEVRARLNPPSPRRVLTSIVQEVIPALEPLPIPPPEPPQSFDWSGPVARIQKYVCLQYGISKELMLSQSRIGKISFVRHVAMYLAHELTAMSLPEIGRRFGGRDHSTVLHGVKRIERLMAADADFAAEVQELRALLAG